TLFPYTTLFRSNFDEERPRPLDACKNGGAGTDAVTIAEKQFGRIRDLLQSARHHFEDADLVARSKTVLDGAQDAIGEAAVAFEVEHRVDHVLDDLGTGDLTVL